MAVPTPQQLPERSVIDFHAGDSVVTIHGVRFTNDSVSGISWLDHLSCDTCRVSYALKEISQLRTGDPGRTAWPLLAPFLVITALGTAIAIALSGYSGN